MEQKVSHVNFLADLNPPMIAGGVIHPRRLLKAIGKLSPQVVKDKVLPMMFLINLWNMLQPTLMHISIQFQTLVGLRGGHFCLLRPCDFLCGSLLLPPFKFQKTPVLISLQHVPSMLVEALLSYGTDHYAPIIPWSASMYKTKYKQLTKGFNLCKASHSSRHTFASLHAAKGTPLCTIQRYMVHVRESTTKGYVHELSLSECQVIVKYPDYFLPLSLQLAPSSHKVLECYPDRQTIYDIAV